MLMQPTTAQIHKDRTAIARAVSASAVLYCCLSQAQYTYGPGNPDELDLPGIRYFGSAKDEKGALLPGVTVSISTQQTDYILVTDELGRFRVSLPIQAVAGTVTAKCSKVGFTQVRLTKRPSPAGPKPSVQLDCVLVLARADSLPK
jgi:hypothetical protein